MENSRSYELHGFDWSIDPLWARFSNFADPVARDDAMKRAAFDYVREHPVTWIVGCFDRLRRFFLPWPDVLTSNTTRVIDATLVRLLCAAIIIPMFVGAAFAVTRLGSTPLLLPAIIPVAYLTALHTVSYGLWRYRIPLGPLLITLAAGSFALMARAVGRSLARASEANQRSARV